MCVRICIFLITEKRTHTHTHTQFMLQKVKHNDSREMQVIDNLCFVGIIV